MSYYEDIIRAIDDGIEGKNRGISLGLRRLDKYVSLRKKMYYLIMGSSGSGKSSLLYDAFILNTLDEIIENRLGINLKIILFSMERSKLYIQTKWLIRKIFLDKGILIPMWKMLNWSGIHLDKGERGLIDEYQDYFNFLEEHIDVYEGSRSPSDVFRIVKTFAEENGVEEEINKYKKIYVPNDKNQQVVVAVDHFGLIRVVKDHPTKKQSIDKMSEHFQYFRDHLGYSVIGVNQMNRDLSSPLNQKLDSFEPHLDNAKETGSVVEAADVVLSLFDPLRYNTNDRFYGDVNQYKCPTTGHKYFRNIKVLKNSYGIDDAAVGVVFQGETGRFQELPKSSFIKENWKPADFREIFNNNYFLK